MMASSLLRVIVLSACFIVLTIISTTNADFPKRKLDCSSVISNFPLNEYEVYCDAIVTPKDIEYSFMNRLDIVEMCSCALLRRQLVWEAMVTHEIEFIYLSSRRLLELQSKEGNNNNIVAGDVTKDNLVLINNPDGIMDFWDRFSLLLREVPTGGKEGLKLSNQFLDVYTNNYYKPEEFKIIYKDEGGTANFRNELSSSCNQLFKSFSPFMYLFNNLREMSENPRFIYRVLTYNENLYKVMVSVKMCKFLSKAGVVTEAS